MGKEGKEEHMYLKESSPKNSNHKDHFLCFYVTTKERSPETRILFPLQNHPPFFFFFYLSSFLFILKDFLESLFLFCLLAF